MAYTPNFNDPRVKKHVKKALGAVLACVGSHPRPWSQTFIDKHVGRQTRGLGGWLRKQLLICTDESYIFSPGSKSKAGKVKEYVINQAGVDFIKSQLGYTSNKFSPSNLVYSSPVLSDKSNFSPTNSSPITPTPYSNHTAIMTQVEKCVKKDTLLDKDITMQELKYPSIPYLHKNQRQDDEIDILLITSWAKAEFGAELNDLVFEYEDKSSRLWHPLQMMRQKHKKEVQAAAGLTWHYDIECCAPTLLLQYAQSLPEPLDLWLKDYMHYLSNRREIRLELANDLECDVFFAKTAINALFCGAKVGIGDNFAIGKLLKHPVRINRFKNDNFIIGLREDIKTLWTYIEPSLGMRFKEDSLGRRRKIPLSPKRKWGLYFDLERKVLNSVRRYLIIIDNPHFLEHDGWVTKYELDEDELIAHVFIETGFKIKLDKEHYSE